MTARETLLTANFDKIMLHWKEMIRNLVLDGLSLREILDLLTAAIYANALLATDNNQCKAALSLGIHRNTLHRKLAQHGLLPKARTKRAL
jgi:DNA-binding protein Fis